MRAFHNDPTIKQRYLDRVAAHRAADELIKGIGWSKTKNKGCAVGCTLEAYDHARYETELGIPQMLARVEDVIFEVLPDDAAQTWPERLLQAAPVGADLSRIGWRFLLWLLRDSKIGAFDHPAVAGAVQRCAKVLEAPARGEAIDMEEAWCAAKSAACAAYADESAARAAYASFAAKSLPCYYATYSAAYAAKSAAYAACGDTYSTAVSAGRAAESAAYAAESAAHVRMADGLIELMETA